MAKQIYIDENGNENLVSGTINTADMLPIQSGSATNTKDYIDSGLSGKADISTTYTKTEVDSRFSYSTTETLIGDWVNPSEQVYRIVYVLPTEITISSNTWEDIGYSNSGIIRMIDASVISSTGTVFNCVGASIDTGTQVRILNTRPSAAITVKVAILTYTRAI